MDDETADKYSVAYDFEEQCLLVTDKESKRINKFTKEFLLEVALKEHMKW